MPGQAFRVIAENAREGREISGQRNPLRCPAAHNSFLGRHRLALMAKSPCLICPHGRKGVRGTQGSHWDFFQPSSMKGKGLAGRKSNLTFEMYFLLYCLIFFFKADIQEYGWYGLFLTVPACNQGEWGRALAELGLFAFLPPCKAEWTGAKRKTHIRCLWFKPYFCLR